MTLFAIARFYVLFSLSCSKHKLSIMNSDYHNFLLHIISPIFWTVGEIGPHGFLRKRHLDQVCEKFVSVACILYKGHDF